MRAISSPEQASGTSPARSIASMTPRDSNIGTTLGPSWMPYPMAPNSGACSRMRTRRPARPKASAVVSPPRPPPTMTIGLLPPIRTSSWPGSSRPPTPFWRRVRKQGVDGRDERGHDEVEGSAPHALASNLLRHADPLDLPFEIDAGCLPDARPHRLAERLDVGRAGATLVDEEIAMQVRHLGGAHRQSAAAGGVDELPCLATRRILEGRAAGAALDRLGRLAAFGDLVHLGSDHGRIA